MAPFTVEGNRDRHEALLTANTAGKMFHLTGGQHMTEDNRWISREMANRALCVAALEKEKKNLLEKQSCHGAALPVLNRLKNELNGNINSLLNSELEKLLRWKGIPVSKMGKHAKRKVLYKQIVDEGGDIDVDGLGPRQTAWTDANEKEGLKLLRTIP